MTTAALKRVATGASAAVASPNSFAGMLERMKPQLAAALPRHLSAERMVRVALTCYRLNPDLADCSPKSVIAAVVQCSQLGLEPGLLGQAYLVPFKRHWKDEHGQWHSQMECQFIPGYRGLISLARRSGDVTSINAEIVYEQDEFDLSLGIDPKITHRPRLDGDRGRPRLAYAIAHFKEGGFQFQWMTIAQIEAIRARSKAGANGPWSTDYDEMVRKTVVRRLCKYLPMSVEMANAVAVSDAVDDGNAARIEGDVVSVQADSEAPPLDDGFASLAALTSATRPDGDTLPEAEDGADLAAATAKTLTPLTPEQRLQARIEALTDAAAVAGLRKDIGAAVRARDITHDVANGLGHALAERAEALAGPGAGAGPKK